MTTVSADHIGEVIREQGRCYIPVPWSRADELRSRLRRLGYASTLCLDPRNRQARIELAADADVDAALEALAKPWAPLAAAR